MNKLRTMVTVSVLLVPVLAWAMGGDHSKPAVIGGDWPSGFSKLVDGECRVHGCFVNWTDTFFFRGDTNSFNHFLDDYARLPNTELQLVVHPGIAQEKSPWDEKSRGPADWTLTGTPFRLTPEQRAAGGKQAGPYVTRVDFYLGERADLSAIVVPANVIVESGGEIEAFVERHKDRRRARFLGSLG